MEHYAIVMTTLHVDHKEELEKLMDVILKEKLAACIQVMSIRSYYVWKEELCQENEVLLMIKTKKNLFKNLEKIIKASHPYETPEIIEIDISDGSDDYLGWIVENTK